MEWLIGILALVGGVFFVLRYLLLKKDVKKLAKDISDFSKNSTFTDIKTDGSNQVLGPLVFSINELVEAKNKAVIQRLQREREMKWMIANISHDLRTPMTSIKGYLSLYQHATEKEREKYFHIINRRLESVDVLIDDFYYLSCVESQDRLPMTEYRNLSSLTVEVIGMFYYEFEERKILPEFDIDEEVYTDLNEEAFTRILTNIVQNVLRYGEDFFRVSLKKEEHIVLRFENRTNRAIQNPEQLFFRTVVADPSRTSVGAGIGLTIAKELAEQLGWNISAEYEDGVFCIVLTI